MKINALRSILAALMSLIFSMAGFGQALNGTYTIGGTTPDYVNFNAAVSALTANGVSGPVTFNIRNGNYNEQVSIGVISGMSSVNTVTFQSETGDSTQVVLYSFPGSTSNYTLRLNGCDYMIFKRITIKATGSSYSTALTFDNGSSDNTIENCILEGSATTATATRMAVVTSSNSLNINNSILNNIILNGSYGIYYYASNTTGVVISGNYLQNQYYRAIDLSYLRAVNVSGNEITTSSVYANYTGISLYYCDQNIEVNGNNINYINGDQGIYINYCNGNTSQNGVIANNFISITGSGTGTGYGLQLENSSYQNVYFNSVNITRNSSSTRCLFQKGTSGSSNFEVRNNIMDAAGGYCMYIEQTTSIIKSNFNNFRTSGSYIGYWNGSSITSLTNWKNTTQKDTNSFNLNPYFSSATDLHIQQSLLNNAGTPANGVINDIDGQPRSLLLPDIGADEWTPGNDEAGVTSIYNPCDGLDSVFVTIKNYGGNNLLSAVINWEVNGVAQTAFNWSGNLLPNTTSGLVNIGYYNFAAGTPYSITAYTSLPNNGTDPFNPNDTLKVINLNAGMSGIYTIGGTSPNYATVNDALNALYTYGVCGPVVFNIRNGTYTQQVTLNNINGTSSANTVTFKSENSDSTLVILTSTSSPATLYFNGASYVTFKQLTIRQTSSYKAVQLSSNSSNLVFTGCILQGYSTTNTSNSYSVVYGSGTGQNFLFSGNIFRNGSYGIYWSGSAYPGLNIEDNAFESQYYRGVNIISMLAPKVNNNYFTTTTSSNTDYISVYMSSCTQNMQINNNVINMPYYGYYGISINSCTGTSVQPGLISNNFITLTGTSLTDGYGIYIQGSLYQNVFYNSVNIYRGATSSSKAFYQGSGGSNLMLYNNIWSSRSGYAAYIESSASIIGSDNNDFYCPQGNLGYWNGTIINNLVSWQQTSGRDSSSFFVNPAFVSNTDLHTQQSLLDDKGRVLYDVILDIDGQSRSMTTPDIGADEWTTPNNDAGISSIDVALTFCPSSDSVYVTLSNYGSTALTFATINWTVNSVAQTPFLWTGSLQPGDTTQVFSIGFYDLLIGTPYSITVSSSDPNGQPDIFSWNDQSQILNKYVSMSGTYTIGGTSPDYNTFTDASNALNQRGVCGPVLFNVRNGNYPEQLTLLSVYGVSDVNTITFQSESGDSTLVQLYYNASSSYTIYMNGCRYVNFREMTIKNTYSSSRAVYMANAASNNSIKNCILQTISTTSSSTSYSVVYSDNAGNANITLDNNVIRNGSYGIYASGSSTGGWTISNNYFIDNYYRGIYLNSIHGAKIIGNTINYNSSYTSYAGIYMNDCYNDIAITHNKIDIFNYGYYGVIMYNSLGTAAQRGLLANNFVSLRGTGGTTEGYGFYVSNGAYLDIFNNNINILRTSGSNRAYFQTSNGNDQRFYNNIFVSNYGHAMYIENPASVSHCDYNSYYSQYGYPGYWNGSRTTLSDWQTASTKDTNSYTVNPYFFSDNNLHVQQPILNDVGRPLGIISDDIDYQARNILTPDIGADEWTIPNNDAGIISIDQLSTLCQGADSVFVVLKNFGAVPLTSVTINWSVNGIAQIPYNWTGNLAPNATAGPFSIGNYAFAVGTQYTIIASTSNPNGIADPFTFNDQSQITNQYVSLSGVYTIGGANPDFATFGAAATALQTYGICSPVIFDVRNGTYTEQLSITSNINGISPVNTITFRSASGDSTQVVLRNSSNTVNLSGTGARYISFERLSIKATSSSRVVYITGNASNITVKNCILEGYNTTSTSTSYSCVYANSLTSVYSNIVVENNIIKWGSYSVYITGTSYPGIFIRNNVIDGPGYKGIQVTGAVSPEITDNSISTTSSQYSEFYAIDVSSSPNASVLNNYIYNTSSGASSQYRGIFATYCDFIKIEGNTVYNSYTGWTSNFYAIYINYCNYKISVNANKIKCNSGYYGIMMDQCIASDTGRSMLTNNIVSMATGSSLGYGLYLGNNQFLNIYYNSVNVTRSSSSCRGLYVSSGSDYQVKNNIFSSNTGYAIYLPSNTLVSYMNYNNYYCPGGNLGYWSGTAYNTLALWQAATLLDSSSSAMFPRYVSDTNLNLQEPLLDNTGNPVQGISYDFYGNLRSTTTPDIGAIEWTAPAFDAGVFPIDDVASFCITSDSVYVTVKNFGSSPLTSCTVNWTVNGVTQTPYQWTGNLSQGQSYGPFAIGYYNFSIASLYSVYAWTSAPNGGSDAYEHNDTSKVLNKYLAMSGVYTIGGVNPDFSTFSLAATSLASSGVCGPVVFNVRPGTYFENVTFNPINGVSSVYTVTFQSETGDSTSVTLANSGIPLTLSGADYLIFKELTIRTTGSTRTVQINSNSANNSFLNCVLEGYTGSSSSDSYALIYGSSLSGCQGYIFNNNRMRYGSYAILVNGSVQLPGWVIEYNDMNNHYYRGIYMNNLYAPSVQNNTVNVSSGSDVRGIDATNCPLAVINGNNVTAGGSGSYLNYYGIYASSCNQITINNNNISVVGSGSYYKRYGIYTTSCYQMTVASNIISANGYSTSYQGYGIYATNCNNDIKILKNEISSNHNPLYLVSCTGNASQRGLVANNFMMQGTMNSVYSENVDYCDFYYNSINTLSSGYGFYQTGGSNIRLKNNSIATASGYVVYVNQPVAIVESDYNNLYTASGYFVGYWSGDRINLAYWQSASGLDAHSISIPPAYVSVTDLHTCNSQYNGQATPVSIVTDDIDNEVRDVSTPDIGADEFGTSLMIAGNISGNITVCSGQSITYFVNPVAGASSYLWTVPSGWVITSGQGTESITVTTGSSSGNVCVSASNNCGSGPQTCLAVSNTGAISAGQLMGLTTVCPSQAGLSYYVSPVSGATAYNWSVPSGWTITYGQNTDSIVVTSGTLDGDICVTVTTGCGTSQPSCLSVVVSSGIASPGNIIGSALVCSADTGLIYTVPQVSGAVSYNWTVPSGWVITAGQGTTSIHANASPNGGNVCVSAVNSCSMTSLPSCLSISINNTMTAPGSITGNSDVCSNQAGEVYSVQPVNGAVSYTWVVPPGWLITSGQGSNAIIVTTGSTAGSVCVSATNGCGVISSQSCYNVSIITTMQTPGTISGLQSVCPAASGLQYSVSQVPGAVSYNWTVPAGWVISSGQGTNSISVVSDVTGGDICVTASNVCNIASAASCLTVGITTTFNAPSAISGSSLICQNEQGLVYQASSVNGAVTYNWTVPAGWTIVSGQGTSSVTVNAGSSGGDVCVTATNNCNITSSPTCYPVNINSSMQAPGSITGNIEVCASMSGLNYFVSPVSGAVSYNWSVPSGWIINSGQGTASINVTSGTQGGSICVTATNSCGTISAASCMLTSINNTVALPGAISGLTAVCSAQPGLNYSIQAVQGASSYNWTVPAGWTITSGQGSNLITVTSGSSAGDICVQAVNICGASSQFSCLTVGIATSMQAPASISGPLGVCQNQNGINYTVPVLAGAVNYNWTVPAGWTIISGQGSTSIVVNSDTLGGQICVTAANACSLVSQPSCIYASISTTMLSPGAVSGNATVCPAQSGLIYSVAPLAGAVQYNWTLPNGWILNSGQGTNTINVTSGSGGGSICVTATNNCNITSVPTCFLVDVSNATNAPDSISGLSSVCPGLSGLNYIVSQVSGAVNYNWTVPPGWTVTAGQGSTVISVDAGTSGNGNICVSAVNNCGISSPPLCMSVNTSGIIQAPASVLGNNLVCQNQQGIYYFVNPMPDAVSYFWTIPSGWQITAGQGTDMIVVSSDASGGDICVQAINACNDTSTAACLSISINPPASMPSFISGLLSACPGQSGINYTVNPTAGAASYNWTVPAGWIVSSGQGTSGITAIAGSSNGDVCVSAVNSCGIASQPLCVSVTSNAPAATPGSISGNTALCPLQSGVTFNILPSSGAASYNWSVPNGWYITSGQGTTGITVTAGTNSGSVCVTAQNICGSASSPSCLTVNISTGMQAPASVSGPDTICASTSGLTYSAAPVTGAASYYWTVPSGWYITSGQGTGIITVYSGTADGNVCVEAVNSCGVHSTAVCIPVVIRSQVAGPGAISGPDTVCPSVSGIVYAVSPVGGALSYIWALPSGWVITSGNGTNSITVNPGSGGGTVCVSTTNGCNTSQPSCMYVYSGASIGSPVAVSGPVNVCEGVAGLSYSILPVTNASGYTWSVPSGWVIVSGQNTTNVTVNAGIYSGSICVTADNLCASSNPVCLPVTINPDPATPAAVSGPDSLCPNTQSVVYYTNGAAYASSYFWSVPAGVSIVAGQGTNTLTVDFGSNAGLFSVIASNNCGQSTPSAKNTYLYAVPSIPVITLVGSDLVSSPAYAYQWYLNGVMIQGATSQTLTPTINGYYSVTVFNQSGCVSSSVSYTYNLSNIGENNDENLVKIYPNPAHDQFVIEADMKDSEKINVALMNTLGELIMIIDENYSGISYRKTVNIEHLPYGVYYLRIIKGNNAFVSKIIRN